MEAFQALSAELSYPSADKLWLAAVRRKLAVTKPVVSDLCALDRSDIP